IHKPVSEHILDKKLSSPEESDSKISSKCSKDRNKPQKVDWKRIMKESNYKTRRKIINNINNEVATEYKKLAFMKKFSNNCKNSKRKVSNVEIDKNGEFIVEYEKNSNKAE
ncbi:MAG: hypothetical protein MHPSP_004051, partial [Paramarteilia canceri]